MNLKSFKKNLIIFSLAGGVLVGGLSFSPMTAAVGYGGQVTTPDQLLRSLGIDADISDSDTDSQGINERAAAEQDLINSVENDSKNIEDEVDTKIKIKNLLKKIKEVLKDREKTIIELRFGLKGNKPKTQKEIATMLGISRSYVSRIETKAIEKLAHEIEE